jgi:hypothetical protein
MESRDQFRERERERERGYLTGLEGVWKGRERTEIECACSFAFFFPTLFSIIMAKFSLDHTALFTTGIPVSSRSFNKDQHHDFVVENTDQFSAVIPT